MCTQRLELAWHILWGILRVTDDMDLYILCENLCINAGLAEQCENHLITLPLQGN